MSWYDWVPQIASSIFADINSNNANATASQQAITATNAATAAQVAGQKAAQQSYDASKANDAALQGQSAAGVAQQQQAIAQSNTLTPAQQLALAEARRQTVNSLNSSDLRGSGRATVAAVKNVDDTMTAQLMDANRARGDQAASALSGQYFNAGQNANTQNANIAASQQQVGKDQGTGINQVGNIQAGNTVNTANNDTNTAGYVSNQVTGSALNDIGSTIAAQTKRNATSYTNPTPSTGQI